MSVLLATSATDEMLQCGINFRLVVLYSTTTCSTEQLSISAADIMLVERTLKLGSYFKVLVMLHLVDGPFYLEA